ncbi:MAG TPA: hypothetical protein VH500_11860 [Nitrososphaeraceae archaeon]
MIGHSEGGEIATRVAIANPDKVKNLQAYLLQQRLTELNHPDDTLVTYPNLGHDLYPSSDWVTSFGPIPEYVLADLYSWLEAHSGFTNHSDEAAARLAATTTPSSNSTAK